MLLLIRHALTESTGKRLTGTAPGVLLSQAGRTQAERLAERLASVPLAGIYASPLERCRETAEAVATARRVTVRLVPDIREVEFGRWTGRPLAQLAKTKLWRQVQHAPASVRFPGGETVTEVQRRSVDAMNTLAARHGRRVVAIVTHGDVIRLALAHYAGVHIDLFQRIAVDPASVSAVAVADGVARILRMNDTGSFDGLVTRPKASG